VNSDLRLWLLDPERRDPLISLYRKDKPFDAPVWVLNEMKAQGLLENFHVGSQGLSAKGRLLAYNIEEFRIQVENGNIFPILEKLDIFPGSIVLDVGCGGGQTLFALANRHPSLALGMDRDPLHLDIAQSFALNFSLRNGSFAFQQADGNFLPLRDSSVDFLICRGALNYLYIRQALQEMARVLKPGGRIFIHALGLGFFMQRVLKSSHFLGRLDALFVIFNGAVYFLTGKQITFKYKKHPVRSVFLTVKSLRALEEIGFKIKSLESVPGKSPAGYYLLVAEKY